MYSLVLGYEVLVDGFAELSCCLMMLGVFRFAYFWVQLYLFCVLPVWCCFARCRCSTTCSTTVVLQKYYKSARVLLEYYLCTTRCYIVAIIVQCCIGFCSLVTIIACSKAVMYSCEGVL